jgi:putative ABC transport system permease protein
MMPDRKMFWRIIRRIFASNRARLLVILLALGAGAAVTAALLNLQVDAKRRLTTEFRAFGPNVVIASRDTSSSGNTATLDEAITQRVSAVPYTDRTLAIASLYLIAEGSRSPSDKFIPVVVAGDRVVMGIVATISDTRAPRELQCKVGHKVAEQLHLQANGTLFLHAAGREQRCRISAVTATGGPEDDQVSLDLAAAQTLAGMAGKISVIQLSVTGTPEAIEKYIGALATSLPDADVHGVRQFTEGEAKIYSRISGILSATVALVLVLTALCVMAAMTNVAMERRNDVGLMKAIGGATRRVLRLFLAEAALLGLTGGVLGAAIGILLSMWLGKAVFGIAARPRLIVYPVTVALTIIVAIAGAYPLRRLANIRPASVFRGEA